MNDKLYCVQCDDLVPFEVRTEIESYPVRGVPTEIEAQVSYCCCCGNQLWNDELDADNINRAYEKAGIHFPPLPGPSSP